MPISTSIDEPPVDAQRKANCARLIQQVYEIDPLECPDCSATLRIIALIDDPGLCGVFFIRRMSGDGRKRPVKIPDFRLIE